MIEFNNIHLNFNGKTIFQDFFFEVKRGEKVVLLGKSGSGKSSIFGLILGFIEPSKGEILFEGVCIDKKSAWDVRKKIAYIDQDVTHISHLFLDGIRYFPAELRSNNPDVIIRKDYM